VRSRDKRSPIRRAVILRRVDPELWIAQFYSLLIERDPRPVR